MKSGEGDVTLLNIHFCCIRVVSLALSASCFMLYIIDYLCEFQTNTMFS